MAGRAHSPAWIDPARSRARTFRQKLDDAFYATSLYQRILRGYHPVQIDYVPRELWPGSPDVANALFQGQFEFAGQLVSAPNGNPWRLAAPSQAWLDELNSFGWLRHFRAMGLDAATRHVEAMVKSWLEDFDQWHPSAWRPDILARRLIAWLTHAPMAISTRDLVYHSAVMNSMARQARHLTRAIDRTEDGLPRLVAAIGLIYSGFCLPQGERRLRIGLAALNREVDRQVLADGGLVTRSPQDQYEALRLLVGLNIALREANETVPPKLQQAIDQLAPMLRFFRMGDGGLALFNNSYEEDADTLDTLLDIANAPGQPVSGAVYSGFQRVVAGPMTLLLDAGAPPPADQSIHAHAGLASFELSLGGQRLITNCGASEMLGGGGWQHVSRTTAAHSTLVLDNRNSCSILENQRIGRRPSQVKVTRDEARDTISLEVFHNGYAELMGLGHRRKLRLRRDGTELAGVDTLEKVAKVRKGSATIYDIRFHLHPSVQTQMSVDGGAVSLHLPDGSQWQLECMNGLMIEESVYLGERGNPQRCKQIIINGTVSENPTTIRWLLSRLPNS